jgi:cytosine/adenosine deaminase-related metal-dependent hydrolase
MPLERYLDAGVKVYLGTDGLCSSPSLDVADEAAFAKRLHAGYVDPKRIDNLAEQPFP